MQDVETNGAASEFASRVNIGGFNGAAITGPGQISAAFDAAFGSMQAVYISNFEENFVSATQDGVDLSVRYGFSTSIVERIDMGLSGLWFNKFTVEEDDFVGQSNGRSVLNGGTIPDWRGNFRTDVRHGGWRGGLTLDFIPSVEDTTAADTVTDPNRDRHVESYTRVDAYVGYQFAGGSGWTDYLNGLTVRVGANNLFDRQPPQAASSWTDHNADTATYGAFGRVIYVDASVRF
jgi:iron complex outermembrane receptor protein